MLGYVGCALADLGQHGPGAEILEQALAIDPSNAQAHVALGATQALQGQWEAGIEKMRHGMRISPRDRRLGFWGWALSAFLLQAGRPEEALREARTSASRDARLHLPRLVEAAAQQALGRTAEACQALAAARRHRPGLTPGEVKHAHGHRVAQWVMPLWEGDVSPAAATEPQGTGAADDGLPRDAGECPRRPTPRRRRRSRRAHCWRCSRAPGRPGSTTVPPPWARRWPTTRYKWMPRARIGWSDVALGSAITALLFTLGKALIGWYIGSSGVASGFGAASAIVALLVWVYGSAQVFLYGAEVTWLFALRFGSRREAVVQRRD